MRCTIEIMKDKKPGSEVSVTAVISRVTKYNKPGWLKQNTHECYLTV